MCDECTRLEAAVEAFRKERDNAEYALIDAEDGLIEAQRDATKHQESCGAEDEPIDRAYHQAAKAAGQVEMLSGVEG